MDRAKKQVLIIDDDQSVLKSILKQLSKEEDLFCIAHDDPVKGLEYIDSNPVDILLCDIKMPPMSGLDVLARVKSSHSNIPVIILTGFVDDAIMEQGVKLGSNAFLIKPVRKRDLTATIRGLLG